jgi:hypothetical protein
MENEGASGQPLLLCRNLGHEIRIYEVYDILKYKEEKQESIKKKNSKVCVC